MESTVRFILDDSVGKNSDSCPAERASSYWLHLHFTSAAFRGLIGTLVNKTCRQEGLGASVDLESCVILCFLAGDTAFCGGNPSPRRTVALSLLVDGVEGGTRFFPEAVLVFSGPPIFFLMLPSWVDFRQGAVK